MKAHNRGVLSVAKEMLDRAETKGIPMTPLKLMPLKLMKLATPLGAVVVALVAWLFKQRRSKP